MNPPTYRTAESFRQWLGRTDVPPTKDLLDWCYYGFGRGRGADDPNHELFKALPENGTGSVSRKKLALRIARALNERPDLAFPYPGYDKAPDHLLYDLLSLATNLACPNELFRSLWNVREALMHKNMVNWPRTRMALTHALISNQLYHPGLQEVWLAMTTGQGDSVLVGPPWIGFWGIGMMPGTEKERPDEAAVSQGLLNLAKWFFAHDPEHSYNRFCEQAFWLRKLWKLPTDYFVLMAEKYQWAQKGCPWNSTEIASMLSEA